MSVIVVVEQHSWKLVPKRTGLLSAEAYERRTLGFEVTVVAHMQQDKQQDNDEEEFKSTFGLKFEVRYRFLWRYVL